MERGRDLPNLHILIVVEHDHLAVFARQGEHGLRDLARRLGLRRALRKRERVERLAAPAQAKPAGAERIPADVDPDAKEPGLEAALPAKGIQMPPRLDDGSLKGVLRELPVAQIQRTQPKQLVAVGVDHLLNAHVGVVHLYVLLGDEAPRARWARSSPDSFLRAFSRVRLLCGSSPV